MKTKNASSLPRVFYILWAVIIASYAVWMAFFLKFDTYPAADTGITSRGTYIIWAIFSCAYLLIFPFLTKAVLYSEKPGAWQKPFCLVSLIFGCAFITWYGFFKNPLDYTASMIGLDYPIHFKMWGLFASVSIFANVLYMYRRYGYKSKAGVICGSVGSAAIFVTINVPSAGEELILTSLRCMSHWTGALVFAVMCVAPIVMLLISKAKKRSAKWIVLTLAFTAVLALMLVLLVTVGKNGLIESLPMWAAYALLFVLNFTPAFFTEDAALPEKAKATV